MTGSRSVVAAAIRHTPAALCLLAAAACGDGTGPGVGAPRFFAIRDALQRSEVWEYDRGRADAFTPDSVRFVIGMSRASDGRVAVIAWMPPQPDPRLIEFSAGGAVTRSVVLTGYGSMGYQGGMPAYSPDGTRLAWFRATGTNGVRTDTLFLLDPGTSVPRAVATRSWSGAPGVGYAPLGWTPQGEVVFAEPGTMRAVSPTGAVRTIVARWHEFRDVDWSGSGMLAIAGRPTAGATAGVYVLPANFGVNPYDLMPSDSMAHTVRWSPDDTRIATNAHVPLKQHSPDGTRYVASVLEIVSLSDFTKRRFPTIALQELHDWTPDGRGVLFSGLPVDSVFIGTRNWSDVYLASARGGTPRNLTNTAQVDELSVAIAP